MQFDDKRFQPFVQMFFLSLCHFNIPRFNHPFSHICGCVALTCLLCAPPGDPQQECMGSHACGQPGRCFCLWTDGDRGSAQESWGRKKKVGACTFKDFSLTSFAFQPLDLSFFELVFLPDEHFRKVNQDFKVDSLFLNVGDDLQLLIAVWKKDAGRHTAKRFGLKIREGHPIPFKCFNCFLIVDWIKKTGHDTGLIVLRVPLCENNFSCKTASMERPQSGQAAGRGWSQFLSFYFF